MKTFDVTSIVFGSWNFLCCYFLFFYILLSYIQTMIIDSKLLLRPISDSFTEDDWKLVQLVVTLFRNILAIQDITLQQKASGSATQFLCLTDSILELLFQENIMDIILVLTQHVGESSGYLQQDNLLLLEIFHNIFLRRDPELIAKVYNKKSEVCSLCSVII